LIERSFQGLSVAIETMRIIEELVEIWPNEVCDSFVTEKYVYDLGNLSGLIRGTIDIEDQDVT